MRRALTVREALSAASKVGCICEAVFNVPMRDKGAAARRVPRGGLLVQHEDGRFLAIGLVPRKVDAITAEYVRPSVNESAIMRAIVARAKKGCAG